MASERVCPKCYQQLEPMCPFAYPNHTRQLEDRMTEYRPGARKQVIPPEGKYGSPKELYWMPVWECTTDGCTYRGGIHQHLTLEATVHNADAHIEPRGDGE